MVAYDKPGNLIDLFASSLARNADRPLFGTPDDNGKYTWVSYADVGRRIDNLRAGLIQLGAGSGDAVGVIANNRTEWAVAAFATFGFGGHFIPMYEKELPKIWKHIIRDGGVKYLFVANSDILEQINDMRHKLPGLEHLFVLDGGGDNTMTALEAKGENHPADAICPEPDDVAVLIYTSGTTGDPKGVLLTHGNFTSNVNDGGKKFPELNSESRSLSILPWAHSYGQTAELYNFLNVGGAIGFIRDVTTISEDLYAVAPTFLIAVPRVFNKIYDGLWAKMEEKGGLAHRLFSMGVESAKEIRGAAGQNKGKGLARLKYSLADKIVFSKIRERFGGNLKAALTASAMMNSEVAHFFTDIGLPVFDAYGLTETSPAVTMNCRTANKPGSVGLPLDNVRVEIDNQYTGDDSGEGEIIVYGPNVMKGYHNKPEATNSVMTNDGGFRTGDMGYIDEDGYLFITGRIKEQYKLENGKYVFPASLEEEIQMIPWIENVLVYGEGRRHNICLIVPNELKLQSWAEEKGLEGMSVKELIQLPEVEEIISEAITTHLKGKFGGYEIPRKIVLMEEAFSVDNGMLTHTLKLKRNKVVELYNDQVQAAYQT